MCMRDYVLMHSLCLQVPTCTMYVCMCLCVLCLAAPVAGAEAGAADANLR